MKIQEAVRLVKERFGSNTAVCISAEHWTHSSGTVTNNLIVNAHTSDGKVLQEIDTTLHRAVQKLITEVQPLAVENVIQQVEQMAE